MMEDEKQPYLYILMRTDLESMNPGKGMAQACHAANCAAARLEYLQSSKKHKELNELYSLWKKSTNQSFGTTIVLDGGSIQAIKNTIQCVNTMNVTGNKPWLAEVIHDPTYPLIDGSTLHIMPLDTCAFIFCDKNQEKLRFILDALPLHM